jgi:RNA polymerase primary sigma factor
VAEIGKIATKDWIRRNDYDYAAPVISYELPVDSDDDTTLKDVIPHPIDDLPQYVLEKEYLRQEVKECLSQLAKSEREFIELRFGFTDGTAYHRTEIAASWKLPIKEVILLERRAMQSLRNLPQVRRLKQEFLDI